MQNQFKRFLGAKAPLESALPVGGSEIWTYHREIKSPPPQKKYKT